MTKKKKIVIVSMILSIMLSVIIQSYISANKWNKYENALKQFNNAHGTAWVFTNIDSESKKYFLSMTLDEFEEYLEEIYIKTYEKPNSIRIF